MLVSGSLRMTTSRDQTGQSRFLDHRAYGLPWLPPGVVSPCGILEYLLTGVPTGWSISLPFP